MATQPDFDCRLLAAAATAYSIGQPGGIQASPQYPYIGLKSGDTPDVFQAGLDDINAGFVGETDDGVLLSFRGTISFDIHDPQSLLDWINDFMAVPVPVEGLPGLVHDGFHNAVLDLWDQFVAAIEKRWNDNQRLVVTGHSKGAGMAPIAAALLVARGVVPAERIDHVVGFAMPKPGDGAFRDYVNATLGGLVRYSYQDDIVPHVPPSTALIDLLAELPEIGDIFKQLERWDYEPVGTLRFINWHNKIVPDSVKLSLERAEHLLKLIVEGKFEQIADDHSLVGGYCHAVCPGGVCDAQASGAKKKEGAAVA